MGRSLSPIIQRELNNLDKDTDSRRAAMRALKSFVKDLDSKAIPLFIDEVSRIAEAGSLSAECTISLFEILVRVHGFELVPFIDSIMASVIKILATTASFSLQQACSKVVPAIARYAIDPSAHVDRKRHVIHLLYNPLSDSLLGSQVSLTSGAALCLKALVENDNWRFASYEMVNKVCQSVAGALEENGTQTNAHMGLVMALAKRNATAVEPYARLLIQAGLRILNAGMEEGNSQKRLSSIQMVIFLIKCLNPWSICSELQLITKEMEKCQSDQMAYVKRAAFEALQTARRIAAEKGSKVEKGAGSITGLNFSRRYHSRQRIFSTAGDQSPASASPGTEILDSFVEHDSLIDSPILTTQDIQYLDHDCSSVDRKLWSYGNGEVDVSLRDDLLEISEANGFSNTFSEQSGSNKFSENKENCGEEFIGFLRRNRRNRISRSATTSPLRSRTQNYIDNSIFTTPIKLIHPPQDRNNMNSVCFEKQTRRSRNHNFSDFERSPVSRCDRNWISSDHYECRENERLHADGKQFQVGAESVSSTEDIPTDADLQVSHRLINQQLLHQVIPGNKTDRRKIFLKVVSVLSLVLLGVIVFWLSNQDESCFLVPT